MMKLCLLVCILHLAIQANSAEVPQLDGIFSKIRERVRGQEDQIASLLDNINSWRTLKADWAAEKEVLTTNLENANGQVQELLERIESLESSINDNCSEQAEAQRLIG